jgi:hypothetical protein
MHAVAWLIYSLLHPLLVLALGAVAGDYFLRLFNSIPDLILRVAIRRLDLVKRGQARREWRRRLNDKREESIFSLVRGLGFALSCLISTFRCPRKHRGRRHSRTRGRHRQI